MSIIFSLSSFLDRSVRKAFLQQDLRLLQIPPFAWSPLSRSVDRYRCILRPLPAESHAFSTKARCPALILFEMEDHPQGLDVASFLAHDLWEYSEDELRVNRAILVSSDDVNDDGSLIESSSNSLFFFLKSFYLFYINKYCEAFD